ncbi:MAG TPA: hypothetical protein VN947_32785 [Polyangia bacterium]|nr:hypothetical protein [Polyangia bacterium]
MAKRTPDRPPPHVVVRSIAFTPAALEALEDLASKIAGRTGRKASVSAVVRALLRQAQEIPDVFERLATLVEHEQMNEVVWGKPPRR